MIDDLQKTFRWFGPSDPVTLEAIRQTGVSGVVTALHHIPCGEVWNYSEIIKTKTEIESRKLRWEVVESVNVHEDIKTGGINRDLYISNYIATLKKLSLAGINTVCYNFMPVLDWTRTNLDFKLPNGTSALRFHRLALAAFDLYILERKAAFDEFPDNMQADAKKYLMSLSAGKKDQLVNTILAGLPGTDEVFTVSEFRNHLERYKDIAAGQLRENLRYFLDAVIPEAEKLGIKMCIHPDDPPFPILGLPRIACTEADLKLIVEMRPSPSNGITFCTGSLGARENDLPGMVERLGRYIHFIHLRNVKIEDDGSFYEAEHLHGSTDMYAVMKNIITEQKRRADNNEENISIPMRPDHGHKIWTDYNFETYPGYSFIGRLKGLAELDGLEMGIKRSLNKTIDLLT